MFYYLWCWFSLLSCVQLFETPWTVGSSVHEISHTRILKLLGIFLTQGLNLGLLNCRSTSLVAQRVVWPAMQEAQV